MYKIDKRGGGQKSFTRTAPNSEPICFQHKVINIKCAYLHFRFKKFWRILFIDPGLLKFGQNLFSCQLLNLE